MPSIDELLLSLKEKDDLIKLDTFGAQLDPFTKKAISLARAVRPSLQRALEKHPDYPAYRSAAITAKFAPKPATPSTPLPAESDAQRAEREQQAQIWSKLGIMPLEGNTND
jgi:hypothetical protein